MTTSNKPTFFTRFLNVIEKGGNALPNPATLFALFALGVLFLSWIGQMLGWQA
ncbi:MAG TPA: aminobenzoyl-glutamate transporter, partial [Bacteroidales bacterium]|nr:aminobenzoyl-glutamate transporter [Bacteroidales bacterium]